MNIYWNNTEILILGGTGSLGNALIELLIPRYRPRGIRIYSRDEFKQYEMRNRIDKKFSFPISYLIGDVRDKERLSRAMNNVDIVINCAAMKQVPACEDNPFEAVKTNIYGAQNIIDCAIDNNVKLVMHISTDKAVYPINLYGGTKLVAEKLFIDANTYTGGHGTMFSCCRYGNVIGSRGSIIPMFLKQKDEGALTITHKDMTRFWILLEDVAKFITDAIEITNGDDIFIPLMPSVKIFDLAKAIAPDTFINYIGIRPGEKLHECLMTYEESMNCHVWIDKIVLNKNFAEPTNPWSYTSGINRMLQEEELQTLINKYINKEK